MIFWTAFLLGLLGSLHCAGMCGPLALALPASGLGRLTFLSSRVAYNLGRMTTYGVLGLAAGIVGQAFAMAGLQRWASAAAGIVIVVGLLASPYGLRIPFVPGVSSLKSGLARLLRQRAVPAFYLLGILNGLLPCGLVYVACAGAIAAGGACSGVGYMLAFGSGTVPLMLCISCLGSNLQLTLRSRFQRIVPVCVLLVGLLLIVRSLSLGIPYVSPKIPASAGATQACH